MSQPGYPYQSDSPVRCDQVLGQRVQRVVALGGGGADLRRH